MALTSRRIADRIKAARKDLDLNQQDLARTLHKTAAAISQLEQGKIQQISALDLHKLAHLLHKPIEYFYGEDFGGQDIQDLVAIIRRMPSKDRPQLLETIKAMVRMQDIADKVNATKDKAELLILAREFYEVMKPYIQAVGRISASGKDAQAKLAEIIETETPKVAGPSND